MIYTKEPLLAEKKEKAITNRDMFNTIKAMLETTYEEYSQAASLLDYAISGSIAS